MTRSTAVIGAGPAGCAAAYALSRQGRRVVLFERASCVGGRTTTWREGGLRVDSGAGFFTSFYPTLERLLSELSLREQVTELSRHSVLVQDGRRGELVVGSVGSFASFPLLGAAAKARMAAATAWITLRHRGLDLTDPASLAALDDASIAQDARRRVGEEAYQVLVRSGIEPFWYFSCEDASRSLLLALQARAVDARFFTLRDGMDGVCHALVRDLDVRTSADVRAVSRSDQGRLRVACADRSELFDEVVFATTADVARRLSGSLAGLVDAQLGDYLESQAYVPNVHATFRVERASCPPGTSAMFSCGPGTPSVAALSFNSYKQQCGASLPPDQELVCVFLAAHESRALLGASEAQIYERCWSAARELCPELPRAAEPLCAIARAHAIPVHAVGRYRKAAALRARNRGPIAFAGDYLTVATVDGALRSGLRAAAELLGTAPG